MSTIQCVVMVGAVLLASSDAFGQFPAPISAPAALNGNAGSDSGIDLEPHVASDGQGHWVAVWASNENLGGVTGTDFDIFVARSTDNGATWTPPAPLNTNATTDSKNDNNPQIATDGKGHWVAVWDSKNPLGGMGTDSDIHFARSTDNGATWTNPVALNNDASSDSRADFGPQIGTDAQGNWLVVWYVDSTPSDVFVARSSDNGATWTPPAPLAVGAGAELTPQIASDGHGTWVAVWDSENPPMMTDFDIFFSRSTDNGATWSTPAALSSYFDNDTRSDADPDIATDGQGNWVAVWFSPDSPGSNIADILVARSSDNGATWSAPGAVRQRCRI